MTQALSKERLEELANFRGAPVTNQEERAMACALLAAYEQEPSGYLWRTKTAIVTTPWRYAESLPDYVAGESFEVRPQYTHPAPSIPAVAQPVMFIDGDISSEDAEKLAKVIREFNEEDERPLAKMARIIRENPHPTNECDMLKNNPAPSIPAAVPTFEEWCESREQNPTGWDRYIMKEAYEGCRAAMLQAEPVIHDDARRMDWLVSKTVNVREPMVYGSHNLFWSQTISEDWEEEHKTTLREQIDAAMAVAPKGV